MDVYHQAVDYLESQQAPGTSLLLHLQRQILLLQKFVPIFIDV